MMPAALALLLLCLPVFALPTLQSEPERVRPHLTGCVSNNMETFRCRWSAGSFQNLSEPRDMRLFYFNRLSLSAFENNWRECPQYSTERPDECFFSENYTTVWTSYTVQLRSRDQAVLYDEMIFTLSDIVRPDPPFGLNWTLMNVSLTDTHFDVMLSWEPPRSADVHTGWMALQYEAQYRQVGSDRWEKFNLLTTTRLSMFGLQTNVNYEVRVRCRMLGWEEFGDFSDSVFIHIPSKVSRFPVMALLVFGALSLVAILLLVIISQQGKLMFILLPPVPGPKIRGIDSYQLKKGKLRELTSILSGPPDLRPELYNNDPWVEFIDLDMEEHSDKLTDCFTERSLSSHCSPRSVGLRDDDSGRSSCCEPDLLSESSASPLHPPVPTQEAPTPRAAGEPSSWFPVAEGRVAAYTQVSEVGSSGNVLLLPEQLSVLEKHTSEEREVVEENEKKQGDQMGEDQRDRTSELKQLAAAELPDQSNMSPMQTLPVYTVVEGVDRQNSLQLTPNPNLTVPKVMPTPDGYLTPDLLKSITP